ncbi:MAG: glycosyltransferase [Gammaproteobacteria bacterium]|nr:glycosyltransferase [Gammaproteobacteria bacterium]
MIEVPRREPPLVSVIVRSVGRLSLQEALDAISQQTWAFLEIIVVNAKGIDHPPLGDIWEKRPLQFISHQEPLSRSRAANLGLLAAQGDYISFLDDDDLVMPNHIARGLEQLQRNPSYRVVYSGVRVDVYGDKSTLPLREFTFNEPFDLDRLRGRNYIPIHAVLFERSLVTMEGCLFDERLDLFEDWDFWLQIAEHSPFLHHSEVTAIYRNHGNSGLGEDQSTEEKKQRIERATTKVFEKWQSRWTASDWARIVLHRDDLTDQVREHAEDRAEHLSSHLAKVQQALNDTQKECSLLQNQLNDALSTLKEQQDLNVALFKSSSWRVTQPLRRLKAWLSSQSPSA